MTEEQLKSYMTFKKNHQPSAPLAVFEVNGSYLVGVYQGAISEFDILIKYRQKYNDKFSRIRTPKHIHWAVDILIKLHEDKIKTQQFLDFLLEVWDHTTPIRSNEQRKNLLSIDGLLLDSQSKIHEYESLSSKGEYSIKFLILLAKLLMLQEKTNLETAYMFKKLLASLRNGGDIFSVVSTATHTRK